MINFQKNKKDDELLDLLSITYLTKKKNYSNSSFFDTLLNSIGNVIVSENPDFVIKENVFLFNVEHFRIDNSHKKTKSVYKETLSKIRKKMNLYKRIKMLRINLFFKQQLINILNLFVTLSKNTTLKLPIIN